MPVMARQESYAAYPSNFNMDRLNAVWDLYLRKNFRTDV